MAWNLDSVCSFCSLWPQTKAVHPTSLFLCCTGSASLEPSLWHILELGNWTGCLHTKRERSGFSCASGIQGTSWHSLIWLMNKGVFLDQICPQVHPLDRGWCLQGGRALRVLMLGIMIYFLKTVDTVGGETPKTWLMAGLGAPAKPHKSTQEPLSLGSTWTRSMPADTRHRGSHRYIMLSE